MKKLFLFAGFLFLSGSFYWLGPHRANDPFPAQREFQIIYQAQVPEPPLDAKSVRIWIPLASTREGQTILERNVESAAPYRITRDPQYGNEMAYLELERPFLPSLDFNITYKAKLTKPLSNTVFENDENPSAYLNPSRLMVVNDTVRARTRNAVLGKSTLIEKARGIYEDVIGRMRYDKTVPGWGEGNTIRACLLGKGNCTDFHSLFISMAHAAEIPARFKIGLTIPEAPEGEIPGYHCWAEFYEEGKGWKPVDASEAWKNPKRKEAYFGNFDTNKFLISVGRDIQLEPRQSGDPVNIFFYPYVEVDGKEWNGVKTSFQFKNLK
ncbi:MAG: transglutaminase domain-containing protein [Candidatus Omnitrophica bacterium]|nr:transglutaminase domain-containing protein [Candidatus Omnitrophota bacterium]